MNLDALKVGKVFKNYKVLCEELEMEVKTSNSKKAQLKELERYCELSQSGHSFTVTKVYDSPLDKNDGRGKSSVYGDLVQLLITDYMIDQGTSTVVITRNNLLKHIRMINENYSYCSHNVPYLSIYTEIDESTIYDFFNTSNSNFRATFETALKNLRSKSLIIYEKVMLICTKNNAHRIASEKEKRLILKYEKKVLKDMGFKEMAHVRVSSRWNEFKRKLSEELNKYTYIKYYYMSYRLTTNEKTLLEEHQDMLIDISKVMESEQNKNKLNDIVCERLIENAEKRKKSKSKNENLNKTRSSFTYINDSEKLVNLLINSNANNIVNDIGKIKKEEIEKWEEEMAFLEELI